MNFNLSIKVKRLDTLYEITKGLMFEGNIKPVYFETRFGIHTFFVKKPIDIIILDDKLIIKKLVHNLRPFRLLFWNPKYKKVIELPGGFIKKTKLKTDNKINLDFNN